MKPTNILIADDHKMFREGLVELLSKEKKMNVVGDVGDADGIREILKQHQVDVILMDIDMGDTSGIDMSIEVKKDFPEIMILALSMHGDKNYIVKMLEAGATGYILKNAGKEEMINAIHTAANGNAYFSNQVSAKLLEHITNPTAEKKKKVVGTPLTDREIEVLKLIADEYSNPEIAEKLFISVRTVDTHRRNLLDKLMVKNTAGLVRYAIQKGLLDD
ncbi:MAG: response regulator transcription factor [Reichenbachiella sp.]|uniref:response regulator transcription factor n=1 Tax=Reichenbachiella sp. TaxID=2184521 RepID=UPI003262E6D9